MPSTTRILVGDLALGALFVVSTPSFVTTAADWWLIPAVVGQTVGCVLFLYLCEHGRPRASLVGFCVQVGGTVGVTALDAPVAAGIEFALFVGLGLGLLVYRFVYGVLRPVPEKRITNARRRTPSPSFFR
ncbi:MAG: hypothetical protein ACOCP2_00615 [Halohasta sp.]